MENWSIRTKILVIASLSAVLAVLLGVYVTLFNGIDKDGGGHIAVYLEGDLKNVDVYSSELGDYIFKELSNRKDEMYFLNLGDDKIGKVGESLYFKAEGWDREVAITFQDEEQQLIRHVIDEATGLPESLYIHVAWENVNNAGGGWAVRMHTGEK